MQFKSQAFYFYSFSICFFFAVSIKFSRADFYGINMTLDVLLGSLPSFLSLFGLIAAIPVCCKGMAFVSYKKIALGLTVGSIVYEFGQYWTSMVFDVYDCIAIILALSLFALVHRSGDRAGIIKSILQR